MYSAALETRSVSHLPSTQQDGSCVPFPVQSTFSVGPVHHDLKPSELEMALSRIADTKVWSEPAKDGPGYNLWIDHHGSVMSVTAPLLGETPSRYLRFNIQNHDADPADWVNKRIEYISEQLSNSYVMETRPQSRPPRKIIRSQTIFGLNTYYE